MNISASADGYKNWPSPCVQESWIAEVHEVYQYTSLGGCRWYRKVVLARPTPLADSLTHAKDSNSTPLRHCPLASNTVLGCAGAEVLADSCMPDFYKGGAGTDYFIGGSLRTGTRKNFLTGYIWATCAKETRIADCTSCMVVVAFFHSAPTHRYPR